jgi:ClpP class serine protease
MDLLTDLGILLVLLILAALVVPRVGMWRRARFRRRLLAAIGRRHDGARVFAIVHGKGRLGFLGTGPDQALDMDDAEAVLLFLRAARGAPVDLILHTPGGSYLAALPIARALRAYAGTTRVIVPYFAMSGGTLIALGASEIVMAPDAALGEVDPQVGDFLRGRHSVASWARIAAVKGTQADDLSIAYGDVSEKLLRATRKAVTELLQGRVGDAAAVAERFVSGALAHGYPLSVGELKAMGLEIKTDVPPEVFVYLDTFARPRAGMAA